MYEITASCSFLHRIMHNNGQSVDNSWQRHCTPLLAVLRSILDQFNMYHFCWVCLCIGRNIFILCLPMSMANSVYSLWSEISGDFFLINRAFKRPRSETKMANRNGRNMVKSTSTSWHHLRKSCSHFRGYCFTKIWATRSNPCSRGDWSCCTVPLWRQTCYYYSPFPAGGSTD